MTYIPAQSLEAVAAEINKRIAAVEFGKANASTVGGLATAMNHVQADVAELKRAKPA